MKKIIIILVCILLCSCSNNTEKTSTKDYVYSSDPILESAMLENKFVIIDVGTKEEYNTGHIKDAINIPYDEIAEKINISKNINIFVYCRSGNRSSIAFKTLSDMGYKVYDLGAFNDIKLEKE